MLEVQQAFALRAAGYDEPRPSSPGYPYLPAPALDTLAQRAGGYGWIRSAILDHGHTAI